MSSGEVTTYGGGTADITLRADGPTRVEPLLNDLLFQAAVRTPGAVALPGWSRRGQPGAALGINERDAHLLVKCVAALSEGVTSSAVGVLDRWADGQAAAARDLRRHQQEAAQRRLARRRLPELAGRSDAEAHGVHLHWAESTTPGCRACDQRRDLSGTEVTVHLYADRRSARITVETEGRARPVPEGTYGDLLTELFRRASWSTATQDVTMFGNLDTGLSISRVHAEDASRAAMCLLGLWQGQDASTRRLLAELDDRPPNPAQDRWLERTRAKQDRDLIEEQYGLSPIVLPQQPATSRAGFDLQVIPATDVATRAAAERMARWFRRESGYDFPPFTAEVFTQTPWLATDSVHDRRVAIGCAGMAGREDQVNMAWIWLHPLWRQRHQRPVVDRLLDELEYRYGAFGIESPFSAPMLKVMQRRGIGEDRHR